MAPRYDPGMRKIIHIDMDAFFASIEQRDNHALRGKAVAVGYAAKRGVVAAASYEARKFGVRSAMPSAIAQRNCPELIFVPPRFEVYRAVSREIRAIFHAYTPLVEPLSLDEAYLDVTDNLKGVALASEVALQIRACIHGQTGLTASAGVSYNKFLAKLASDQNKPNGQFVVTPGTGPRFVEGLPVERFHGVGPKTAEKMKALGIHTGADLRACPLPFLEAHFGRSARWYYGIARGEDDRPVEPNRVRKSSGSETTFDVDLVEPQAIEAGVIQMADEVWSWCAKHASFGHTVSVKVKFASFRIITRSKTLPLPVTSQAALRELSLALVRTAYPMPEGVRLLGVIVSNLAQGNDAVRQLELGLTV